MLVFASRRLPNACALRTLPLPRDGGRGLPRDGAQLAPPGRAQRVPRADDSHDRRAAPCSRVDL